MMKKRIFTILMIVASVITTSGCTDFVLKTVMKTVDPYFHGTGIDGTKFEQITEKIYTFR